MKVSVTPYLKQMLVPVDNTDWSEAPSDPPCPPPAGSPPHLQVQHQARKQPERHTRYIEVPSTKVVKNKLSDH